MDCQSKLQIEARTKARQAMTAKRAKRDSSKQRCVARLSCIAPLVARRLNTSMLIDFGRLL